VLGDCSDHRACLRFQPRLGTCRQVSTLCSRTVSTIEHVFISNHTWGLVDQSLRRAQGLCRPPSTFTFPTMLEDSSITLYIVLGAYFDHPPTPAWELLLSVTYELDSYTIEWQFEFLIPCYKAHILSSSKLGDYIGMMHLAMHLSIRISMWIFLFRP
jgi:hypothetical protein